MTRTITVVKTRSRQLLTDRVTLVNCKQARGWGGGMGKHVFCLFSFIIWLVPTSGEENKGEAIQKKPFLEVISSPQLDGWLAATAIVNKFYTKEKRSIGARKGKVLVWAAPFKERKHNLLQVFIKSKNVSLLSGKK